ncbi:MAG: helix-turn-helix transcriptional regulator [Clostridia bacterium]|nr:helix-turn-helix transcriptional regulator [Clostridia bacterium]
MPGLVNERIRSLRKQRKYSQKYVAQKMNMKVSTYSQMEREGNITCDSLIALCEIFNADVLSVLYGEDIPQKYCKVKKLTEADFFEKLVLYALRNLQKEEKQEVFEVISRYIVL